MPLLPERHPLPSDAPAPIDGHGGVGESQGTASLTSQAYAAIRQSILDLQIRPGEPIAENTLARWLGMSRTPVREAILRLRQEGWVYSIHRKGLFVSPVSLSDFRQAYETLEGLEAVIARLVIERATDADLDRVDEVVRQQEAATEADDRLAWTTASRAFHSLLAELSGNRYIAETRARLHDQMGRASRLTLRLRPRPSEPTSEHRALAEALRRRDVPTAMLLAHEHRARVRQESIELLQEHLPDVVAR